MRIIKLHDKRMVLNRQPMRNRRFRTGAVLGGLSVLFLLTFCAYFGKAMKGKEEFVVVIDAGHGGYDPGKVGVDESLEKDINLAIARETKKCLEQQGITVIMTREADESLATSGARNRKTSDMLNRVEIANAQKTDLLISIHQNSYPDASVRGAQVFYHDASEKSRAFGELLQEILISDVDTENHRQAKKGNDYYILRKSTCPGVILECGFLSSPTEAAMLNEESYQKLIAKAITKAVCIYRQDCPKK